MYARLLEGGEGGFCFSCKGVIKLSYVHCALQNQQATTYL